MIALRRRLRTSTCGHRQHSAPHRALADRRPAGTSRDHRRRCPQRPWRARPRRGLPRLSGASAAGPLVSGGVARQAPSCWDGRHVHSPDRQERMAHAVDGGCTAKHPVAPPMIEFKMAFPVDGDLSRVRLSSGRGYSIHDDFFTAGDARTQAAGPALHQRRDGVRRPRLRPDRAPEGRRARPPTTACPGPRPAARRCSQPASLAGEQNEQSWCAHSSTRAGGNSAAVRLKGRADPLRPTPTIKAPAAALLAQTGAADVDDLVPYGAAELVEIPPDTDTNVSAGMRLGELARASVTRSDGTAANLGSSRSSGRIASTAAPRPSSAGTSMATPAWTATVSAVVPAAGTLGVSLEHAQALAMDGRASAASTGDASWCVGS